MINENQIDQIVEELIKKQYVECIINGELLVLRFSEGFNKLHITASVFDGGNYIPESVRRGVKAKSLFPRCNIQTFFTLDEKKFQVVLNFSTNMDEGFGEFSEWINDFIWIAKEWRFLLDRYGQEDLVFVYASKN
ncbi:MAG: hypothetical protein ACI9S8_000715 [Chlamydiales bacterium]|jgi:hypothetical protein